MPYLARHSRGQSLHVEDCQRPWSAVKAPTTANGLADRALIASQCEHAALRHLGHREEGSPRERADGCGWSPGPCVSDMLMFDHVGPS